MRAPELQAVTLHPGGAPVRYYRAGKGEPLLYLHHIAGMQGWEPAMDELAGRYDVIAPYHPGWGPTEGLDALDSGLDLVLHYADFLDAVGVESAHVLGHSIGAWIGAELAAIMPDRVRSLVLATPIGIWTEAAGGEDPFAQPPMSATAVLLAEPSRRHALILKDGQADMLENYVQEMKDLKAAAKFLWPVPDTGVIKHLPRIKAPTLVVTAARDKVIPPAYGPIWEEAMKRPVKVKSIEDAGHLANLEQPERFAAVAGAFFAG